MDTDVGISPLILILKIFYYLLLTSLISNSTYYCNQRTTGIEHNFFFSSVNVH